MQQQSNEPYFQPQPSQQPNNNPQFQQQTNVPIQNANNMNQMHNQMPMSKYGNLFFVVGNFPKF